MKHFVESERPQTVSAARRERRKRSEEKRRAEAQAARQSAPAPTTLDARAPFGFVGGRVVFSTRRNEVST